MFTGLQSCARHSEACCQLNERLSDCNECLQERV
jgi:hypothetical protein